MAIAFDAATGSGFQTGVSSVTFAKTCTGANLILFVAVKCAAGDDDKSVTSITYNGVNLTHIQTSRNVSSARAEIWYLVNPATGSNNVVVQMSNQCNVGFTAGAISYTGASQSGQPDNSGTATNSSVTTNDVTLTTVKDNCWVLAVFADSTALTAGVGTTLRLTNFVFDNNAAKHPAGSVTIEVTQASSNGAQVIASFSPSLPIYTISASETQTITELFSRLVTYASRLGSDLPSILDSVLRGAWSTSRSQQDSPGISEQTTRAWSLSRGLPIDNLSITEGFNSLKQKVVSILETLGILDSVARGAWVNNQNLTDSGTPTDIFSRVWSLSRNIGTENISITELFSSGRVDIRNMVDAIGMTETFSKATTYGKNLSESLGITEIFSKLKLRVLNLLETVAIIENNVASSRIVIFANRAFSENISIVEWFATPLNWINRTQPTTLWTPRNKPYSS